MSVGTATSLFDHRWVCGVVRSGYHNGARCSPDDPHEGWGCGMRLEVSMSDSPKNRLLVERIDWLIEELENA